MDETFEQIFSVKKSTSEPDLPPEFCHYKDTGCEKSPSCLNCPFPDCIEGAPQGSRMVRLVREPAFVNEYRAGQSITEIAAKFQISTRTVKRAVRSRKNKRALTRAKKSGAGKAGGRGNRYEIRWNSKAAEEDSDEQ